MGKKDKSKAKKNKEKKVEKVKFIDLVKQSLEPGGELYLSFNFLKDLGVIVDTKDLINAYDNEQKTLNVFGVVLNRESLHTLMGHVHESENTLQLRKLVGTRILNNIKNPTDIHRRDTMINIFTKKLYELGYTESSIFDWGLSLDDNLSASIEFFFTDRENAVHELELNVVHVTLVRGDNNSIAKNSWNNNSTESLMKSEIKSFIVKEPEDVGSILETFEEVKTFLNI